MRTKLLFFCVLLAGCSKEEMKPPAFPVPVEVGQVTEESVPIYLETIGHIQANVTVDVRPQVSGQLLEAHVGQGQKINKGDLLYTIDPRPYKAAVNRAKAMILKNQAEAEFTVSRVQRYTELVKKEFVSPLNFDEFQKESEAALAQVLVDVAELEIAQVDLDYTEIVSPIDGIMGSYKVYPGNWVQGNDSMVLTQLRQIDPVDVSFAIPQKDFQEIQSVYGRRDWPVEVFLPYGHDKRFFGWVYFIDNTLNTDSGTINLKAHVSNEDEWLWPGEFIRVKLLLRQDPHARLVPFSAIQVGQKGEFVYIVQPDQTVEKRRVKTGQHYNGKIQVTEGVAPGETVVTNGQINLRSGSRVSVQERG